jgi:hypothetical protein
LTHAPQTCLSTYSSTLAYLADALTPFKAVRITRRATSKAWRIIADYLDLSRANFKFLKFSFSERFNRRSEKEKITLYR